VPGRSAHLPPPQASLVPTPPRSRPPTHPMLLFPPPPPPQHHPPLYLVWLRWSAPALFPPPSVNSPLALSRSRPPPPPPPCSCSHPIVDVHFLPQPRSDPLLPGVTVRAAGEELPELLHFNPSSSEGKSFAPSRLSSASSTTSFIDVVHGKGKALAESLDARSGHSSLPSLEAGPCRPC
jgi:hypothetical protein